MLFGNPHPTPHISISYTQEQQQIEKKEIHFKTEKLNFQELEVLVNFLQTLREYLSPVYYTEQDLSSHPSTLPSLPSCLLAPHPFLLKI